MLFSLFIAAVAALAFTVCDTIAAHWGRTGSYVSLGALLALSASGYLVFALITNRVGLGAAGGIVNGLIVVFTALAGVLFFGEQNFTPRMLCGLGLVVGGVIVLAR